VALSLTTVGHATRYPVVVIEKSGLVD